MDVSTTLVAKRLGRRYGEKQVLSEISLSLQRGEVLAVIGESGTGKSTLLRILAEVEQPSAGELWLCRDGFSGPPAVLVWQDLALFERHTIAENISFGLRARSVPREDIQTRVNGFLGKFSLTQVAEQLPGRCSGGERQRAALARAMILESPILLLDEPFGAVDSVLRDVLRHEIRRFAERGSVVLVSHDRDDVAETSDRVIVLEDGRLSQEASFQGLVDNPASSFAARFSGHYNLVPSQIIEGTRPLPAKRLAAIRQSAIYPCVSQGPDGAWVRARVLRRQAGGPSFAKVYAVLDHCPEAPFVYYSPISSSADVGARVALSWPASAVIWYD